MKDIYLSLHLKTIPPVARRNQHVLILIQTPDGKLLLGGKKFYPPGIVRLLGGGMEPGEDPLRAAQREMEEELHITLAESQLEPIAKVVMAIRVDTEPNPTVFTTFLYFAELNAVQQNYSANDDIDQVAELSQPELEALIQRYGQLPTEPDGGRDFAWADYGVIYGQIHQIALEFVRARN